MNQLRGFSTWSDSEDEGSSIDSSAHSQVEHQTREYVEERNLVIQKLQRINAIDPEFHQLFEYAWQLYEVCGS
jgi:hypothetical protein